MDQAGGPKVLSSRAGKAHFRAGKGFSLQELAEVKLSAAQARDRGIRVDERRKTKHGANVVVLRDLLGREGQTAKRRLTFRVKRSRGRVFRGLTA